MVTAYEIESGADNFSDNDYQVMVFEKSGSNSSVCRLMDYPSDSII